MFAAQFYHESIGNTIRFRIVLEFQQINDWNMAKHDRCCTAAEYHTNTHLHIHHHHQQHHRMYAWTRWAKLATSPFVDSHRHRQQSRTYKIDANTTHHIAPILQQRIIIISTFSRTLSHSLSFAPARSLFKLQQRFHSNAKPGTDVFFTLYTSHSFHKWITASFSRYDLYSGPKYIAANEQF